MKIDEIVAASFSDIFEKKLRKEISDNGVLKFAERDKILLEIRRDIRFIPFIVSGVAKVMRRDGQGNGILLHYLSDKQCSAIAVSYAMVQKKSEIRIKAECDISYIAMPVKVVNLWFVKYASWRDYYFNLNHRQSSKLIENINDLAFTNLEERIIKYLEETSIIKRKNTLNCKHFDIARDMKVSREAVSRVLKKLEKDDILTLGRNRITLN
jgi:CRP/FNR family transcriptional regulator